MITTIDTYKKIYEEKNKQSTDLIIVDVQKKYQKYFNNTYLLELKKYAEDFQKVHQIWNGNNTSNYDYYFPNQTTTFELKYDYLQLTDQTVDSYFYNPNVKEYLHTKFNNDSFKVREKFKTITGEYWIYIGNMRDWFFCNKELTDFFLKMKKHNRKVTLVGGISGDDIYDIYEAMSAFGINVTYNKEYMFDKNGSTFAPVNSNIKLDKYLNEIKIDENREINLAVNDEDQLNTIDLEDIPDDMVISGVVDVLTNFEEVKEKYGDINMFEKKRIKSTNLQHRSVKRSDIIYVVVMLEPRNKSAAHNIGEMGVVQCRVINTYYGLNRLKQLKRKGEIVVQ